jgi:Predicted membrane protein (DUF2142)
VDPPTTVADSSGSSKSRYGVAATAIHHGASKGWVSFVWAFLATALSVGAWSISTPLGAAPDEPSHIIEAAAAVRGEFDSPRVEVKIRGLNLGRVGFVKIPEWVNDISNEPGCYLHRPATPASCSPPVGTDTRSVREPNQFSNYPLLYYLIVGVPTLVSIGSGALHAMQYTGALLDAALIALGLFLLACYSPSRAPLVGALVALSPMVLFLSAVVNSSGMEIAAAFAAWCGGLCIVQGPVLSRGLAVATSISVVLLILSRPISPVNAAVIVAVVATVAGCARLRTLLRERRLRLIWIPALLATVAAGIYILIVGLPSLLGVPKGPRLSAAGAVWLTLRQTGDGLRQCIGDFGWLDTPAPGWVIAVWSAVVAGLLIHALLVSPRDRRALLLLTVAILAMPVLFESPEINTVGLYWQGRYWLPLVVGLPLVGSCFRPHKIDRLSCTTGAGRSLRLTGLVIVGGLLAVAQLGAFLRALHRYETGIGPGAGATVRWVPPGGSRLVIALFIAGQILLLCFVANEYARGSTRSPS